MLADNIHFTREYIVLHWCLELCQKRKHPRLFQMAIDILSAPAMSAECSAVQVVKFLLIATK